MIEFSLKVCGAIVVGQPVEISPGNRKQIGRLDRISFGKHDPWSSHLLSWTDSKNGQDGNYLFELEARFARYLKRAGGPERGSVTTASSKLSTSIEQPLKTSGPRSGLHLNGRLLHDFLF